jgi:hypothetical protein
MPQVHNLPVNNKQASLAATLVPAVSATLLAMHIGCTSWLNIFRLKLLQTWASITPYEAFAATHTAGWQLLPHTPYMGG